jgi:hypothetical protein
LSENPDELGDQTPGIRIVAGDRRYFQRPPCVERWLRNKGASTWRDFSRPNRQVQILKGLH